MTIVEPSIERSRGYSFRKLPSGGRGEYEVVGHQDGSGARDLVDLIFVLKTPFGLKVSNLYVGNQGAKSRMRSLGGAMLIQRQLASMMMLPRSTRSESSVSSALPVLLDRRYIMDIEFELVSKNENEAVISPRRLIARSGDLDDVQSMLALSVEARFERVERLFEVSDRLPEPLRGLVDEHSRSIRAEQTVGKAEEKIVTEILDACADSDWDYLPGSDPLPLLELLAGLKYEQLEIPSPQETPFDQPEIRLRSEHIFRMRRVRGNSAIAFKRAVQKAYNYTCLFCGLRAPGISNRMQPGVDAAHILPYGDYDLDETTNGMMLCKLHHWAFDNHLLVLDYANGDYFISMGPGTDQIFMDDSESLATLQTVLGKIPHQRLPKKSLRPNPTYLRELYRLDPYATSARESLEAGR
jgi:hypothetical protein